MIIHIGKGKTGTSFLQEEIFQSDKNINYIAKTEDDYPQWLIQWHYSDDLVFNEINEEIVDKVNSLMSKDKINLISSEAFSIVGNLYQQAIRIKKIQPNTKILITLRDPLKAILSFYKYSVQSDKLIHNLEKCIDYDRTPMVFYKRKPIYLPDYYYDEIIEVYQELFGKENICILKYEDMVNCPDKYFTDLSNFLGVNLNINEIKMKLNNRLNTSPKDEGINKLRAQNIWRLLKNQFPNSNIDLKDIVVDDAPLMADDLRQKLIAHLKGKCYGYY